MNLSLTGPKSKSIDSVSGPGEAGESAFAEDILNKPDKLNRGKENVRKNLSCRCGRPKWNCSGA